MAYFTLEVDPIKKAVDLALAEWARVLQDEIVKITPRDPKRPPLDTSRKVTWNLKRSVQHERVNWTLYKVWVVWAWVKWNSIVSVGKWATPAEYWLYLEFWTIRMKPRSFIRKALLEQEVNIQNVISKVFSLYIR